MGSMEWDGIGMQQKQQHKNIWDSMPLYSIQVYIYIYIRLQYQLRIQYNEQQQQYILLY